MVFKMFLAYFELFLEMSHKVDLTLTLTTLGVDHG